EQSSFGPHRVKDRRGVTLGEDKTVVVMIARVLGIITHVTEEQSGHQFGSGTAGRGMAAAGGGRGSDRMDAQLVGNSLQQLKISFNHGAGNLGNRNGKPRMISAKKWWSMFGFLASRTRAWASDSTCSMPDQARTIASYLTTR